MRLVLVTAVFALGCGQATPAMDSGFGGGGGGLKDAGVVDAGTPCRSFAACTAGATCLNPDTPPSINLHPCTETCTCDDGKFTCVLVCAPAGVSCPPAGTKGPGCIPGMVCQTAYGRGEIVQCTCNGNPRDAGPTEQFICF